MAEEQQALPPQELTAENSGRPLSEDHFKSPCDQIRGPWGSSTFPPQNATNPSHLSCLSAEGSAERDPTEGHVHPCLAALVLLLLPWCQHIFTDNSQEALTLRGEAQAGSLRDQPCCRMAASSREPAQIHGGSSILSYGRRLQQSCPSKLFTQKSLRSERAAEAPGAARVDCHVLHDPR